MDSLHNNRFVGLKHTSNVTLFLTPWSEYASELYRPSDRRVTDPYGRILGFIVGEKCLAFKTPGQIMHTKMDQLKRPNVTPRIHGSEQDTVFPPRLKFVNYSKDRRIMARCED
jgi:hypothetical protein